MEKGKVAEGEGREGEMVIASAVNIRPCKSPDISTTTAKLQHLLISAWIKTR